MKKNIRGTATREPRDKRAHADALMARILRRYEGRVSADALDAAGAPLDWREIAPNYISGRAL